MAFGFPLLALWNFACLSGALQSRLTQKGISLARQQHIALQPSSMNFVSFADLMTGSAPDGLRGFATEVHSVDKKKVELELLSNEQKEASAPSNVSTRYIDTTFQADLSNVSVEGNLHKIAANSKGSNAADAKDSLPATEKEADEAVDLGGGLQLWVTRKGNGKTFPKTGDQVAVEYTGYLPDGTSFDSSHGRGMFPFDIGRGEVIRGWDVGLLHMSLGERAVLKVPAGMAYGAGGQGPIPPNADLVFDVDLRGINSEFA